MKTPRGNLGEQASVVPPAGTTLNPADCSTSLTLSAGNLRATRNITTAARWVSARSTTSRSAGKLYAEAKNVNATVGASGVALGLATSSFILDDGVSQCVVGRDATGLSIGVVNDGTIYQQNLGTAFISAWFGAGDICAMAVDLAARLFWVKLATFGNWNGNPLADPSTGAGGIAIVSSASLFIAVSAFTPVIPDIIEINCGATSFAGAVPSGFSAWG